MPDWKALVRERLATLRIDPSREADILEELAQHLDERYTEGLADGLDDGHARRRALDELIEPDVLTHHMGGLKQARALEPIAPGTPGRSVFADLRQDLHYAFRTLRRQPGFTLTAVITLALGIGATSALVAVADATLLRPLPFPDPDRLLSIRERTASSSTELTAAASIEDWRTLSRSFGAIGGYVPGVGGMVMTGADGSADTIPRQWVTHGYFEALGVPAIAGRTFTPDDDRAGLRAMVLTESFWRARFGGDRSIIGTTIRFDGEPWEVIGVVPDTAQVLPTSVWGLARSIGAPPRARAFRGMAAVGRVHPGVTREAALADLERVAADLARTYPATNEGRSVAMEPLRDAIIGRDLRQTSALLLGVVGAVLLLCCANLAGLQLVRAIARTRELAIRTAIGADRGRILRQLFTESLVLVTVGGLLGLALGAVIVRAASLAIPAGLLPSLVTITFDARVAAASGALTLAVGLLFGLAPAWHASRTTTATALAMDGRSVTAGGHRLRGFLVGAEVAAAVLLLVGAGLLLRTLMAVEWAQRGYTAESVLTMLIDPLGSRYPDDASEMRLYEGLAAEISALPGVRHVGWATTLPQGPSIFGTAAFTVEGADPLDTRNPPTADYQIVSPGYFETIGLPILSGRGFTDQDRTDSVPVCLVNEAFVRRHLQGREPIGARVAVRFDDGPDSAPIVREVVGVVRQVKGRPDETEPMLQIYVPLAQFTPGDVYLLVRPQTGSAAALAPSVRRAIERLDPDRLLSVSDVVTLEDVVASSTGTHRFRAILVTAFAILALVVAMVGVSGVMVHTVQQRQRELGLRRALGATARDVLRLVLGSASRVLVVGTLVGFALAAASARVIATLLYGVGPFDVTTIALVTVVVALTTACAAAVPAIRALRVDPARVLRE